jgi:hypothetical protein
VSAYRVQRFRRLQKINSGPITLNHELNLRDRVGFFQTSFLWRPDASGKLVASLPFLFVPVRS